MSQHNTVEMTVFDSSGIDYYVYVCNCVLCHQQRRHMGVIAWKKCDDQELVFITLLEPRQREKQACAGRHLQRLKVVLFSVFHRL